MATSSLIKAIGKLAIAGEEAGFSIDEMIEMLNSGVTVESLLQLISFGLTACEASKRTVLASRHWVM